MPDCPEQAALIPFERRLRRTRDYDRVQRTGRRIQGRHLVVVHATNGLDGPRFGLAVSRKVGNAVVRNRVKRWIRDAIRHHMAGVPSRDVVFIARASAATAGHAALSAEVDRALGVLREVGA
ncbi:MAG: ribonuclease P protein component [Myxococcales bacterium]|nr:ribonuclease P protein component [Myxococcales bacterium]